MMRNVVYASERADVVHGEWIERIYKTQMGITNISYFCSICDKEHYFGRANYCPNCGAKMDGKRRAKDDRD